MSSSRAALWRAGINVAIFAAAALTCGEFIRRRLPFPPVPTVQPKVEWLRVHGDEYDTFFVGSSRIYRHIVPQLFDELMAARGEPTRSFNLGFDGMRPPEDSYVLEQVLAHRTKPLKYVIVEGNDLRVNFDGEARGTMRAAYWHDLKRCLVIVRATLWLTSSDETTWLGIWEDRFSSIDTFLAHVQPALSRALNVGRGMELLTWLPVAQPHEELSDKNLGDRRDGYFYGPRSGEISKADRKKLESGVAERLKKPTQPFFSDAESQRVLQEKRRVTELHGGQMLLVHPPKTQAETFYPDPQFGPLIPVINLSDPVKQPDLFDPRYRKDDAHLNPAGAEIFTRLFVEELLRQKAASGR